MELVEDYEALKDVGLVDYILFSPLAERLKSRRIEVVPLDDSSLRWGCEGIMFAKGALSGGGLADVSKRLDEVLLRLDSSGSLMAASVRILRRLFSATLPHGQVRVVSHPEPVFEGNIRLDYPSVVRPEASAKNKTEQPPYQ